MMKSGEEIQVGDIFKGRYSEEPYLVLDKFWEMGTLTLVVMTHLGNVHWMNSQTDREIVPEAEFTTLEQKVCGSKT